MARLTRREFLKLGALTAGTAVSASALTACSGVLGPGTPAKPKSIVVTAYAGVWEQALREGYIPVFKKKHPDVEVEVLTGDETAWVQKIKADPKNPPIHVLMAGLSYAYQVQDEGLTEKITEDRVPNLKDVYPQLREPFKDMGVMTNYALDGIMYNKDEIKNPPKTWQEFADRVIAGDFGKRVTLPGISYPFTDLMLIFQLAQGMGVSLDNIQPVFDKIKAMKPNVVKWWTSITDVLNLFTTKEAIITIYVDGRAWGFHNQGNPWVGYLNPKPKTIISPVMAHKVKNSPDVAWDFVDAMLDPEGQAVFANKLLYPMSNSKAKYDPAIVPFLSKVEDGIMADGRELAKRKSAWLEKWNKEIGG